MDLGQARRGVDMGPAALRYAGSGILIVIYILPEARLLSPVHRDEDPP